MPSTLYQQQAMLKAANPLLPDLLPLLSPSSHGCTEVQCQLPQVDKRVLVGGRRVNGQQFHKTVTHEADAWEGGGGCELTVANKCKVQFLMGCVCVYGERGGGVGIVCGCVDVYGGVMLCVCVCVCVHVSCVRLKNCSNQGHAISSVLKLYSAGCLQQTSPA